MKRNMCQSGNTKFVYNFKVYLLQFTAYNKYFYKLIIYIIKIVVFCEIFKYNVYILSKGNPLERGSER